MSDRIEALPWDSDFFDLSIGQVDLSGVDPADLDEIVAEARDRGFACVYGSHEPAATPVSAYAQDAGFQLVEVNQLMHRAAGPFDVPPTNSTVRLATDDDLDLINDQLELLAPWSRFGADPRFGQSAARRMHRAWIERAMADPHRLATISEDENGIDGVGTHVLDEHPRIDLLAVIRPGTYASWTHIAQLLEWGGGGELLGGPCAARNLAPLRFLENCGFKLRRVTYTHHWWAS